VVARRADVAADAAVDDLAVVLADGG